MGYTVAQVEEIASKLRALPEIEPPPKDLSKQEVVKMLAREIKVLQKKGYSLEQIANSLKGEGLDISTPTLKSYLQRTKTAKSKSSTSRTPKKIGAAPLSSQSSSQSPESASAPSSTELKLELTPPENISPPARKVEIPTDNKKVQSSSKSGSTPRPDSVDL